MDIATFTDLLVASKAQPEPQRLLLVFVAAELPDDATEQERIRHAEQQGGSLKPVLCVDKLPAELADLAGLLAEASRTGVVWDLFFVAGMAGRAGIAPNSDEAEQPLKMMVGAIEAGSISNFLAFDRTGQAVTFY